jgi:hypothetical protein
MTARRPAVLVLFALLVAAAALVLVEIGLNASGYGSTKLADPCRPRTFPGGGVDAAVQRIVLDGLSGAACKLGTSREELVLSLGTGGDYPPRRWDRHTIEVALRAGMVAAVDHADERGDIPGFLAPLIKSAIEAAPLDQLIRGAIGLRNLLG